MALWNKSNKLNRDVLWLLENNYLGSPVFVSKMLTSQTATYRYLFGITYIIKQLGQSLFEVRLCSATPGGVAIIQTTNQNYIK